MKAYTIIIPSLLLWISCKSSRNSLKPCCNVEVKTTLKTLSKCIAMNKNTKVYALQYSLMPDIQKVRFKTISDSLEKVTSIPYGIIMVKHFLYCKQLEALPKIKCNISLQDIRKYFGIESERGSKNNQVHSLFYWFDTQDRKDCYSVNAEFGRYSKCSLLTFEINEKQILTNVRTDTFSY